MPPVSDAAAPTTLGPGGTNAVGRMLGLLGDEWTLLIIQQTLSGATRYGEFMDRLPISNSVLTHRLRVLSHNGLLIRTAYQTAPVRAEYLISQRGRAVWPFLLSIWEWERRWVPEQIHRLPGMRHTVCGTEFAPLLTCRSCGEVVTEKQIAGRWGPSGSWPRSVPNAVTRRRATTADRRNQAGAFPETMSVFGNRWSTAMLVCAFGGTKRFTDFQFQLAAPPTLLAERLQTFCANGVLSASRQPGPARIHYRLTEKGRALFPVIITAVQYGQQWFHAPEGPAIVLTHRTCDEPFAAQLACDQCVQPLTGAQVSLVDQPTVVSRSRLRAAITIDRRATTMPTPTRSTPPRPR